MDPSQIEQNFISAYHVLTERVNQALCIQIGDVERLALQRTQALQLMSAAEQVSF